MSGYSDDHSQLLKRYLNFFHIKKETAYKEVKLNIKELEEDALENQVFTRNDVESIFKRIYDEVTETYRNELDRFYKMSGVFVQMLLHDAEKQKANLSAEVSFMENYKALEEIKQFEESKEDSILSLKGMVNKMSKMGSKLPSLIDKKNESEDSKSLAAENEALKAKIAFQEQRLIQALQEKSSISSEFKAKASESDQLKSELEGNVLMSASEKQSYVERIDKMTTEIKEYKKELNTKVSKLKQVEAMKKMLGDKNKEIKELRDKLAQYEG